MEERKYFDVFFERHIGFGIRWETGSDGVFVSFAFPFVTFVFFLWGGVQR